MKPITDPFKKNYLERPVTQQDWDNPELRKALAENGHEIGTVVRFSNICKLKNKKKR